MFKKFLNWTLAISGHIIFPILEEKIIVSLIENWFGFNSVQWFNISCIENPELSRIFLTDLTHLKLHLSELLFCNVDRKWHMMKFIMRACIFVFIMVEPVTPHGIGVKLEVLSNMRRKFLWKISTSQSSQPHTSDPYTKTGATHLSNNSHTISTGSRRILAFSRRENV